MFGNGVPVLLAKLENLACSTGRFDADLDHSLQKKFQPSFKVTTIPHRLQTLIVGLPVLLEVMREIQHRLAEHPALAQQKRDEQPPCATVALEEGMDRLELRMGQADLHQQRKLVLLMQESLERPERGGYLIRHQARTPDVAQQLGMDLADQPHGNRQLL